MVCLARLNLVDPEALVAAPAPSPAPAALPPKPPPAKAGKRGQSKRQSRNNGSQSAKGAKGGRRKGGGRKGRKGAEGEDVGGGEVEGAMAVSDAVRLHCCAVCPDGLEEEVVQYIASAAADILLPMQNRFAATPDKSALAPMMPTASDELSAVLMSMLPRCAPMLQTNISHSKRRAALSSQHLGPPLSAKRPLRTTIPNGESRNRCHDAGSSL